jgi:uncharacterized membrane protein
MNTQKSANQSAKVTPSTSLIYVIGIILFLLGYRMVRSQQALLQAREGRLRTELIKADTVFLPLITTIHPH